MLYMFLVVGLLFCAVQAIRAARLLPAAFWLAGVSALLSISLYTLGAPDIAVIELSVGVGLVTVLLVYAISITDDGTPAERALVPRPLAWVLVVLASLVLAWMIVPRLGMRIAIAEPIFGRVLWQQRGLDVLGQVVLIFAGAIGVLGLLADPGAMPDQAEQAAADDRLAASVSVAVIPPSRDVLFTPEAEPEEVNV